MTGATKIIAVHPHQGAGSIYFGMSHAEVTRAVGLTPKRSVDIFFPDADEDFFPTLGFSVRYDKRGECNAIVFSRNFGFDLEYEGYGLLSSPAIEVRKWALSKDPTLDLNEGFTSKVLGLGMWVNWVSEDELEPDELQEPGMSFIVFRPGYFEEEKPKLVLPPGF